MGFKKYNNKELHSSQYKTWYGGAGMIILNKEGKILLVKGTLTDVWSFPKGHPEKEDNDDPLNTAIRETAEETNLEYNIDYTLYSNKPIRTQFGRIYYLAKINPDSLQKVKHDVQHSTGCTWFSQQCLTQAIQINTDVKYILKYKPL